MTIGLIFIVVFSAITGIWFAATILFLLEKDNKDFEDSEIWKDENEDKF